MSGLGDGDIGLQTAAASADLLGEGRAQQPELSRGAVQRPRQLTGLFPFVLGRQDIAVDESLRRLPQEGQLVVTGHAGLEVIHGHSPLCSRCARAAGTTGKPKGAIITHANLFWVSLYHNAFETGLNRYDVNLASAPLFHIGALAVYTVPGLYWGACSVIQESFDAGQWLDLVDEHSVTKAFAVPTMWSAIADEIGPRTTPTLDVAFTGGAPCPLPVIQTLQSKGMRFTEGFGLTETTAMASALPAADITAKLGSIGLPALHVDFTIVDALGESVPTGEVGELLIRGPSVSPGYWNNPEATQEAFRDGWFHSGDLATVDEDGYYRIVDRMKDMLISGGENVYPVEIEQVLYAHPSIAEVAVVGTPDEKWGETVAAVIVLSPGEPRDHEEVAADIREFARDRLARFKVPRQIEFAEELPRTATGKIRKTELRSTLSPAD